MIKAIKNSNTNQLLTFAIKSNNTIELDFETLAAHGHIFSTIH